MKSFRLKNSRLAGLGPGGKRKKRQNKNDAENVRQGGVLSFQNNNLFTAMARATSVDILNCGPVFRTLALHPLLSLFTLEEPNWRIIKYFEQLEHPAAPSNNYDCAVLQSARCLLTGSGMRRRCRLMYHSSIGCWI
jgi:hypothetical protein